MPESGLTDRITGLVHEPTQRTGDTLDLTVNTVSVIETPGRVDFGGGELTPAETTPHETTKRNPTDEYAWWELDTGGYLIEYNESLRDNAEVVVQTREALRSRGAFHPTLHVTQLDRMPLYVATGGLRLKENARVSTARLPSTATET